MVALPGIVQHLLAQGLINIVLICVNRRWAVGHADAVLVGDEAIVRIEAVIEGEGAGLPGHGIDDRRHGPIHLNYAFGMYGLILIGRSSSLHRILPLVEWPYSDSNLNTHLF